jgi:hypothetical protein
MFSIKQKNNSRVVRCFTHKLADIAGGVNISTADLVQATLPEGTPVGKDNNGLYHVVKTAVLAADAGNTATTLTVKKGHNFKVGDNIFAVKGGKCYAISSITTNSDNAAYDDIVIGTTLGVALSAGAVIMQGNTTGASAGAFKYQPVALTGEGYDIKAGENLFANAWLIAVVKEAALEMPLGNVIKTELKGIITV